MNEINYVFLVCFFALTILLLFMAMNLFSLRKLKQILQKDETKI